jgi:hypothetical protein
MRKKRFQKSSLASVTKGLIFTNTSVGSTKLEKREVVAGDIATGYRLRLLVVMFRL